MPRKRSDWGAAPWPRLHNDCDPQALMPCPRLQIKKRICFLTRDPGPGLGSIALNPRIGFRSVAHSAPRPAFHQVPASGSPAGFHPITNSPAPRVLISCLVRASWTDRMDESAERCF